MNEQISHHYQNLFQIQILHHYWLDEGAVVFDQIADAAKKANRLSTYDVRNFLTIAPTKDTAILLNTLCCLYKMTALGVLVAVRDGTIIPTDTVFEWVVTVKNADFFNYTSLTLRNQNIHTLYHALEKKVYRYKENVPVLSNLTGVTRGTGSNKTLYLSQEFPSLATDEQIEALILSSGKIKQLANDQPSATKILIGNQKDLPAFIHQGDVPTLTPPIGLDGVPKQGILLTDAIPDSVFALIRLNAIKNSGNDIFSLVDNSGLAKANPPIFQVRFKNRSTIWQYFNKSNGVLKSEEANPLPLTYFGNALGTKQKPSAGLPKAIKDGVRIIRLVSEIFE
jgi:hypothetical protein